MPAVSAAGYFPTTACCASLLLVGAVIGAVIVAVGVLLVVAPEAIPALAPLLG